MTTVPAIAWLEIDAVVFDIGGVFLLPHPEPIRAHLATAGVPSPADDTRYHRAHYRAVHVLAEAVRSDPNFDESKVGFWRVYEQAYLRDLGLQGDDLARAIESWPLLADLAVPELWRWVLTDNVAAMHRLAAAGVPVAIVSNNDGSAAQQMTMFGVCQVGEGPLPSVVAIIDSGSVGVAKPDPAIFSPALDALDTQAARTIYVGDMFHADVKGAQAAGMPVVQIDPYGFHDGWAHARVANVGALADRLLS
jgi:FMN phosphatase YigB (HAD superfamily)